MSRPEFNEITSGVEAWDAEENDNWAILSEGPWPIFRADGYADLTEVEADFPAANHEQCIAMFEVDSVWGLYASDGATWLLVTEVGGSSAAVEAAIQKSFFDAQGFLPADMLFEALNTFQAVDFQNLNGGSKTISMSQVRIVTGGGGALNFGWDIGSAKSKVLALCHFRPKSGSIGIFISGSAQSVSDPKSGYHLMLETVSAAVKLYKVDGSSAYVELDSEDKIAPADAYTGPTIGLALYYDDATGRIVGFVRFGVGTWMPVIDITGESTYTTMRYVMVSLGVGGVVTMWASCPVAIYSEA